MIQLLTQTQNMHKKIHSLQPTACEVPNPSSPLDSTPTPTERWVPSTRTMPSPQTTVAGREDEYQQIYIKILSLIDSNNTAEVRCAKRFTHIGNHHDRPRIYSLQPSTFNVSGIQILPVSIAVTRCVTRWFHRTVFLSCIVWIGIIFFHHECTVHDEENIAGEEAEGCGDAFVIPHSFILLQ